MGRRNEVNSDSRMASGPQDEAERPSWDPFSAEHGWPQYDDDQIVNEMLKDEAKLAIRSIVGHYGLRRDDICKKLATFVRSRDPSVSYLVKGQYGGKADEDTITTSSINEDGMDNHAVGRPVATMNCMLDSVIDNPAEFASPSSVVACDAEADTPIRTPSPVTKWTIKGQIDVEPDFPLQLIHVQNGKQWDDDSVSTLSFDLDVPDNEQKKEHKPHKEHLFSDHSQQYSNHHTAPVSTTTKTLAECRSRSIWSGSYTNSTTSSFRDSNTDESIPNLERNSPVASGLTNRELILGPHEDIEFIKLLNNRQWNEAAIRIRCYPMEARMWIITQQQQPTTSQHPCDPHSLHSFQQRRKQQRTPRTLALHMACAIPEVPKKLVESLMRANPEAVRMRDESGRLPLHVACYAGASFHVIRTLLRAFPNGCDMPDGQNRTPLKTALLSSSLKDSQDRRRTIVALKSYCVLLKFAMSKIEHNLGSAHCVVEEVEYDKKQRKHSMTAPTAELYSLIQQRAWGAVMLRAAFYPVEARTWIFQRKKPNRKKNRRPGIGNEEEEDHEGEETTSNRGGRFAWRLLPIHAACLLHAPASVIDALIAADPDGPKMRDDRGCLPLHVACCVGCTGAVVRTLLRAYPGSCRVPDALGSVPYEIAERGPDGDSCNKAELLFELHVALHGHEVEDKMPPHEGEIGDGAQNNFNDQSSPDYENVALPLLQRDKPGMMLLDVRGDCGDIASILKLSSNDELGNNIKNAMEGREEVTKDEDHALTFHSEREGPPVQLRYGDEGIETDLDIFRHAASSRIDLLSAW